MANAKAIFIGEVTQIAGVAAVVAGIVLSLHHWPAAVSDRWWCRVLRREESRALVCDDPADSARYGLVSGVRLAGVGTAFAPFRAGQAPPLNAPAGTPHFVTGMPLDEQIARQISATDPTSRAIHSQRLEGEAKKFFKPKKILRRRW